MHRSPLASVLFAAIVPALGGCHTPPVPDTGRQPLSAPSVGGMNEPDGGTVRGVVRFEGKAPARRRIDIAADPALALFWGREGRLPMTEDLLVGEDNALQNVLVYVRHGLKNRVFPVDQRPAEMRIRGTVFTPHVLAMRIGQRLVIHSHDVVPHGIALRSAPDARLGPVHPAADAVIERLPVDPELGLDVQCQAHPWERAYLHVLEHPFFAVTGADGVFELRGLPPGEYEIAVWHERQNLAADPPVRAITIKTRGAAVADFTFRRTMPYQP